MRVYRFSLFLEDLELTFTPCRPKNSTKIVRKLRTLIRHTLLRIKLVGIFNQNFDFALQPVLFIPIFRRRHEQCSRRQRPFELTLPTIRSRHDAEDRVDRKTAESTGIVSRQCSPNPDNLISSALVPWGHCSVAVILMHPGLEYAGSAVSLKSQSAFCIAVVLYFSFDLTVALQLSPFAH